MIETMVNFRPRELWPRRKLRFPEAMTQGQAVYDALVTRDVIGPPTTKVATDELIEQAVTAALVLFDAASREYAYHRYQEMLRETGGLSPTSMHPSAPEEARVVAPWQRHVERVDDELLTRAAPLYSRQVMEQLLDRARSSTPGSRLITRRRQKCARLESRPPLATCNRRRLGDIIMAANLELLPGRFLSRTRSWTRFKRLCPSDSAVV